MIQRQPFTNEIRDVNIIHFAYANKAINSSASFLYTQILKVPIIKPLGNNFFLFK